MEKCTLNEYNKTFSEPFTSEATIETLTEKMMGGENVVSIEPFKREFRNTNWRWLALLLISFMSFGNYFWYDNPNVVSEQLKELVTHESHSENTIKYNQLYSFASYPNIILPLIGGILADKFGLYKIMISFSLFIIVGQGIFAFSGFMGNKNDDDDLPFIISIIGRTVYGFGGEILGVCQFTIVSKWFKEK